MEKEITIRDFADIKRMAQIVNPLVSRKQALLKKINALADEIQGPNGLDVQIQGMEAGIKARFLGLSTEQLVRKAVIKIMNDDGTFKIDPKTGKQVTKTIWEPLDCLQYNKDKNNYTLTVLDVNECCYQNLDELKNQISENPSVDTDCYDDTEENTPIGYSSTTNSDLEESPFKVNQPNEVQEAIDNQIADEESQSIEDNPFGF